jgi:hypothetical protein
MLTSPRNDGKTPKDFVFERKKELYYNNQAPSEEYDQIIVLLREHGTTKSQPQEKDEAEDGEK